ncbi:MAG: ATPase [Hyphomicrobiales bacterium]|nr:MAG: ATPase [Hyphomicrobiales bacterium]
MPKPLTIEAVGDRQLVITRDFDGPRDLVWLCYTKPELLRRWYGLPDWQMTVCDIDLRVGGKWRFVSVSPGGYEMASQGIYTLIDEPRQVDQTEAYDDNWTGGETINELRLDALGDGRTRTITTVTYATPEARAGAAASPMADGMEIGFKRLDQLVAEETT